jgi:hypothetical protein
MKKAFKIIFIYLGVILLALLATVIFCAGFLFFYREGNIFGIQYISTDEVLYAKESEDMSDLQTIELYSESFDVQISVNENVDTLMGAMKNKVFGYAKKTKAHASFSLEYDEVSKTAVFDSKQPKGWLNKKKSFVEIAIPQSIADSGCDLVIKTSRADIKIGGTEDWVVGDLVVESSKGNINITNMEIANNINVNIGTGKVYIDETCSTTSAIDCQISVGSGVVNFTKINTDEFAFGVVTIKSIKRGKIGIIKMEELITDGNIKGGGRIEIGDVGFVDFESLDTDILIRNINGVEGSDADKSTITITGNGEVSINKAESDLEVNGHNGDIYVNVATESAILTANQGDIEIDNATKLVAATTTYGNIDIQFAGAALDYSSVTESRAVVATTKNGHIMVKGLQYGSIEATDSGRISLEYDRVVGDNKVVAKYGVVNIVVPNPTEESETDKFAFNLKVNSEVNCDIKVGVVGDLGAINPVDYKGSGVKEFSNIYNSGSSTSNTLNVNSTTGIIKIRSMDLVGF